MCDLWCISGKNVPELRHDVPETRENVPETRENTLFSINLGDNPL